MQLKTRVKLPHRPSMAAGGEYDPTTALLINDLSHLTKDDPIDIYLNTLSWMQQGSASLAGDAQVLEPLLKSIAENQPWETPVPNPTADAIRSYAVQALNESGPDLHPTAKFLELLQPISLALEAKLPLKHKLTLYPAYNVFYNIAGATKVESSNNDQVSGASLPDVVITDQAMKYSDIPLTALDDIINLPLHHCARQCLMALSSDGIDSERTIKLMQAVAYDVPSQGAVSNATVEIVQRYAIESLASQDDVSPGIKFVQKLSDLSRCIWTSWKNIRYSSEDQYRKGSKKTRQDRHQLIGAMFEIASYGMNDKTMSDGEAISQHEATEDSSKLPTCAGCGATDPSVVCARCKGSPSSVQTWYCNDECRNAHGRQHRNTCRKLHGARTVQRAASALQSLYYILRQRCHEFKHSHVEDVDGLLRSVITQPHAEGSERAFPFVRFDDRWASTKEDKEALLSNLNSYCPARHMFPLMRLFFGGMHIP